MELQNFSLDRDGISLNWQGHNLDLHNDYDFKSLHYEVASKQVKLLWQKSMQSWATAAPLISLCLLFKNVSFLRVKERDTTYPSTEDECLANVSFHSIELRDEFDSISLESSLADDLTFFFQSEWGLRINADAAELLVLD